MRNLNLKLYLLIVLTLSIFSCDEDNEADPLFEENPTARLEAQESELRDLLTSSEYGWKTTYFTDDSELGGWTFIFDFEDSKRVTMVSDYSDDTYIPNTSEYDIIVGSTIKLSFSTKNYIHNLSDSDTYPDQDLRGQGYKGDFEFLYYGQEGDELVFRSNRLQKEVRFVRADQEDWQEITENREILSLLNQSVYSRLILRESGSEEIFDYSFNTARRYATVTNPEVFNREISFGVGLRPNSIIISPGIEVDGELITELTYDADNNRFVSSITENPAVEIVFSNQPFVISDDYLQFEDYAQYGYIGDFNGATNTEPTSSAFLETFLDVQNNLFENEGVILTRIYITIDAATPYIYFILENQNGNDLSEPLFFNYTVSNADKKIIFTSLGWNNDEYADYLQPITDMFIHSDGLYFENIDQSFQGYPKFTLTSSQDPIYRVTFLGFL